MKKSSTVQVWEEEISIPTYPVGKPEKNPMFFEKRVYQGSSGMVYPHPIIEKIFDEKQDESYKGLFLENAYLKILVLPELGGRIQMAYDKIKERHFVYHNQVIKPALVGLLGPWISGGIEFNWPQHHRPSTFQPIDFTTDEHEDGSKTIWTNEVEIMTHTKGMAGFTLYPGKAYLEINVQLYNRTSLPQTFLWWANPAVSVNEHYQSVFPPDVNAVFDHGKRDVATFPIATGTYYKVDYSPGTDISRYKNIPVPTSYMAIQSDYDFIGGYEHDENAGLLHVANHHISPGKKQWTWGNGDFGDAWERNLTDEDGPYIELMTGVYTDNQPDFSWLMPLEEKSFSQYFFPYRELNAVKNASKDLVLNVEPISNHKADITLYATSDFKDLQLQIFVDDAIVFEDRVIVSPEDLYKNEIEIAEEITRENYLVVIKEKNGKELLRYNSSENRKDDIPKPAQPAKQPEEIENVEQLYLTGLHLEQYRHATYRPEVYYKEALRRSPGDIRNNNALGRWYLRNGRFEKSENHFRKAIETLTERNPNPYNGEPYHNLGVCLKYQGSLDEAYSAFYKCTWNSAWCCAGYFHLAEIDLSRKDFQQALEHINRSLEQNSANSRARGLKAAILRKLGQFDEALQVAQKAIEKDRFNLTALFEKHLVHLQKDHDKQADDTLSRFLELSRNDEQNTMAYALDYASAGLFDEAIQLLSHSISDNRENVNPMVFYYLGWFYSQKGDQNKAKELFNQAAIADSTYCFPNRLEAIPALKIALDYNNQDAKAAYYLGCLYYDKSQHNLAIDSWESSRKLDASFPTVHRNLGIGYFNKKKESEKAVKSFEIAFELDRTDARVFMELDQFHKRTGKAPGKRLELLEEYPELVDQRDDLYLERASLYNLLGQNQKAYRYIMDRKFHPWEGGEGKVSEQYVYSLTELAKKQIRKGNCKGAIQMLKDAQEYPPNLGEGKLNGTRENDIFYWLGIANDELGDSEIARKYFEKATEGDYRPDPAIFYNDQAPHMIFYQGLAWLKLNQNEKACNLFKNLIQYGEEHKDAEVTIDYFAVSLPNLLIFDDDLNRRNHIHCDFMEALGHFGLNQVDSAHSLFEKILNEEPMHFGAKTHLELLNSSLAITT
ncbi:MAG: DUF5107 domain-containing protein [Bacteroidetes bacterium]|jgi:tetratricopeptide (TPR) repeat protein|nr:DUF5107 domain-containing protein [Bacteroidota bacterium]